jgi:nitroimidazol reductase NimA-like FMN-containing flavoprotein (pyridoxamine 5'-phosphate oxidase superfamily)
MLVHEMSEEDCLELLARAEFGRLGCCFENQAYIVPMALAYEPGEPGRLYALTTLGQKVEWMRLNPKVCVEFDEIASRSEWSSVIVYGQFRELVQPRFAEERERGRKLLEQRHLWWQTPLAVRHADAAGEGLVNPIFFSVEIGSVSGLRSC